MKNVFLRESMIWKFFLLLIFLLSGTVSLSCSGDEKNNPDPVNNETPLDKGPVRILAIGNSFSQDAVEQYLYELAEAEGIEIIVANLYIGGCSLERHVSNARNNSAAYEYRKITGGVKTNKSNVTLAAGLTDESWDYISLQQVSGNSGQYETFAASLPELVQYVKTHTSNKNMQLMLHQTWAYAANSNHADFPKYDKNQTKMYEAIVDAVNRASQLVDIDIIIPSGTAIQNGRTSYIGDNFTRDGYHLEVTYGRYTAACTWFEKIFGKNVVGNTYAPDGVHASKIAVAQHAAHTAVRSPDAVTVLEEYKNHPVDTDAVGNITIEVLRNSGNTYQAVISGVIIAAAE
ncbi:MAG: DUF4886 domain-containing protein [Prevotellaceae bacterium]|jgi:hypothetical protein|nr:DUF4886 domain-containing protein [Prevotellaceae bacterium]